MKYVFIFFIIISASFSQDKGIESYQNNKYDDARSFYENILRKRKNDDSAKFGLGVSAYKQKDISTAINTLNSIKNTNNKASTNLVLFSGETKNLRDIHDSFKVYVNQIS